MKIPVYAQLAAFNALTPETALEELTAVTGSAACARSIAAGRPFPMFTQLFSQLSTAWLGLTDDERSDAFFRPFGDAAFEEYARRYGFEFVPSPDDRYGELSAICRRRLVNSAASERHSASENHLRLIENKLSDMIENIQAR